jgi:hypothetical protein
MVLPPSLALPRAGESRCRRCDEKSEERRAANPWRKKKKKKMKQEEMA